MKLFVDDVRPAPKGWYLARTVTEAIRLLDLYEWEVVSLDHDIFTECKIGEETITLMKDRVPFNAHKSKEDYTAVARFMATQVLASRTNKIPKVRIHTANPIGYERLKNILCNYEVERDTTYTGEWRNE